MEGAICDICFTVFSEECVPKVLECGHTICLKCLENILKDQKFCPTCKKTLLKSLNEYPTNFIVLNNNKTVSKENCYLNYQEMNSLTDKVNSLLLRKETFKNSIEERMSSLKSELVTSTEQKFSSLKNELMTSSEESISSLKNKLMTTSEESISSFKNKLMTTSDESISFLKNELTGSVENFERILHKELELSDAAEQKELMEEIDRHSKEKKKINYSLYEKEKTMLQMSQYKNKKHFLYDLVVRLQNDERIYACELIGIDGWRYGEITFSENRIHIHCLSFTTIDDDILMVLLRDLRKCFDSKEDVLPFIRIGNQKLIFTLTENLTFETLRLIKLFTGEGGQTLKGIEVWVKKNYSVKKNESETNYLDLNTCLIPYSKTLHGTGYEDALFEKRSYEMNKDDIILQSVKGFVVIGKVPEMKSVWNFLNVVGKLHKDFQIDFDEMLNKEVEDSGICFSL